MAKILGSEGKLGVRVGSTWGTHVSLGAGHGMCFESLEYNDNPNYLDFNSKGCGLSMKNHIQRGFLAPTLTLNYHLKYGGNQARLLAGFFGATSPSPSEVTASQGDYSHFNSYLSQRKFFSIAVQTTSNQAIAWASCYPVSVTISANWLEPVLVSIQFVTTPKITSNDSTNTFISLNSVTETTTADYVIYGEYNQTVTNSSYLIVDEQDVTWSEKIPNITGFNYNINRPMEHIAQTHATTVHPEPIATGIMDANLTVDMSGLDDNTFYNYQSQNKTWQSTLRIQGSQIGTGERQSFFIESPALKYNSDVNTSISSDGINSATLGFDFLYEGDLTKTDAVNEEIYTRIISKDSAAYF